MATFEPGLATDGDPSNGLEQYAGRYSNGPFALFTVDAIDDYLAIVPPFWTSKPYLAANGDGGFSMRIPHADAERKIRFVTDDDGSILALQAYGWNRDVDDYESFQRLGPTTVLPVEDFLAGRVDRVVSFVSHTPGLTEASLADLARNLLISYPTMNERTAQVLSALVERFPESSMLHALLGYAQLAENLPGQARKSFEAAVRLDASSDLAEEALRRLTMPTPGENEGYRKLFPYPLESLFAPPTATEIAAVRAAWADRELEPDGIHPELETTIELSHAAYDVRIVSHNVHGARHFGAILTPPNLEAGHATLVLEARCVDPRYTPNDISDGTQLMRALGEHQSKFVFVIPSFRGETLVINGHEFTSEGDRADSWDGATDDSIALLNVALQLQPRLQQSRVVAYGKSRGGSVALLTGIRDPRITLVLSLAGPTDWFVAMENRFFSTVAVLRDMLRDGTPVETTEEGGQFYERFIAPVARGDWTLEDARHSMIAGSPLYFLESLPRTVAVYGGEDRSVPVRNAHLLEKRLQELGRADDVLELTIFEGRGHDTDPLLAMRRFVDALLSL